jgi:hypothetical protein
MARRMTKAEVSGIIWLTVIGLPIYLVYQLGEAVGWGWFALGIILLIAGYFWHGIAQENARRTQLAQQDAEKLRRENERRSQLLGKYADDKVVDGIMRGSYWQGQTAEQLRDSLGTPSDTDEKVLKTRRREIWKYHHLGGNRFGLRITLEQDQVVGWEEKM